MTRRLLAAALVAGLLGGCGDSGGDDDKQSGADVVKTTTTRVEVVEGIGEEGGFDPRAIYEREAPGVVTVISVFGEGGIASILRGEGDGEGGLGSGFVLNGDGEVVTNAHVVTSGEGEAIKEAKEVYVAFADGNRVEAKVRGHDPNADIALLEIDPSGLDLRPLPLGDIGSVEVGEPVAALGSPFGEEQSLSVGVVSAIDRDIDSLTNFKISGAIQTDAAINPGNSGGPLMDAQGRVIGINQQIRTRSGGGEGVGFAVPVDMIKRSLEQLRESGKAEYAYLGVASQPVYPQLAERFDLPVDRGAWIQEITPNGPAADAGLKAGSPRETEFQAGTFRNGGDVIIRVGDTEIADSGDLAQAIARFQPGEEVEVELYRDGKKRTEKVRLGDRPLEVANRPGR